MPPQWEEGRVLAPETMFLVTPVKEAAGNHKRGLAFFGLGFKMTSRAGKGEWNFGNAFFLVVTPPQGDPKALKLAQNQGIGISF